MAPPIVAGRVPFVELQHDRAASPAGAQVSPELWRRAVEVVQFVYEGVVSLLEGPSPRDVSGFLEYERRVFKRFTEAGDQLCQAVLESILRSESFCSEVDASLSAAKHGRCWEGRRGVVVRFLGGSALRVTTRYLLERGCSRAERRRRKHRQRGGEGNGCYPDLRHFGVVHRVTPAVASEIGAATAQGSFEEATRNLRRRGLDLNKKTVRAVALELGERGVQLRQERIEKASAGSVDIGPLAGQRVGISVDGGRLRTREGGQRGRRRKNGHRGYRTPWREPKVIVVYVLDEKGKKARDGLTVYDATMGNADDAFDILIAELRLLGARRAAHLHICGDGAEWIWDRVDRLVTEVGIAPEKVTELVDWYHAVEKLGELADQKPTWSATERKRWLKRAKRALVSALGVETLLELARSVFGRRLPAAVRNGLRYFANHRLRMRYRETKALALPLGSGIVESAVRRIVNLRFKNPGTFWRKPNAEKMLQLRAKYLSDGWEAFVADALRFNPSRELKALS